MISAADALTDTAFTCINRELGDHPIITGGQPGVMFSGSCLFRVSLNGGYYTSSRHIITWVSQWSVSGIVSLGMGRVDDASLSNAQLRIHNLNSLFGAMLGSGTLSVMTGDLSCNVSLGNDWECVLIPSVPMLILQRECSNVLLEHCTSSENVRKCLSFGGSVSQPYTVHAVCVRRSMCAYDVFSVTSGQNVAGLALCVVGSSLTALSSGQPAIWSGKSVPETTRYLPERWARDNDPTVPMTLPKTVQSVEQLISNANDRNVFPMCVHKSAASYGGNVDINGVITIAEMMHLWALCSHSSSESLITIL